MLYCIVLRQGLMSEIFSTHHVYPSPRPLLLLRILARWFFLFRAPRSTRSSAHAAVVSLSLLSFDESSLRPLLQSHTVTHTHTHRCFHSHIHMHRSFLHPLSTPLPPSIVPLILTAVPLHHRETTALGTRASASRRNLKPWWLLASTCLYYLSLYMKRERDSEYERGRSGRW